MQQAGYHHANSLAQQLSTQLYQQLTEKDNQLLSVIQLIPNTMNATSISNLGTSPSQKMANAVSANETQLEILKLLRELRVDIKTDRRGGGTQSSGSSKPQGYGRNKKTPDDQITKRTDTSHYCWTHGAGNHDGKNCKAKAEGHRDAATKENKMGGSKAYCN